MEYVLLHTYPNTIPNYAIFSQTIVVENGEKYILLEKSLIRSLCINLISNVNKLMGHVLGMNIPTYYLDMKSLT